MRLYASVGDARGTARAQNSLTFALLQMGRLDEAKAAIELALATARACGDARNVANCLNNQASIAWVRGDVGAGRELQAQALAANKALSTLPVALQQTGMMCATIPAALLMARIGRRGGFWTGAALGTISFDEDDLYANLD